MTAAGVTRCAEQAALAAGGRSAGRPDYLRWLRRGTWALADQALFATSNLIVNVLLARQLPPREYGAFVLAYGVFLLLGQVHIGMLAEPLQVFGAGKRADHFARYLRTLSRGHWLLAGGFSVLLALAGVGMRRMGSGVLASAFLALAVAGPFISFSWLMRVACSVQARLRSAVAAGALNLVLVVLGVQLLHFYRALSVFTAVAVIGLASLVASLWLVVRLRVLAAAPLGKLGGAAVLSDHWVYGRWSTGAGLLYWVPNELFHVVLPIWGGLQDTAALRAMGNVLLPAVHAQVALGMALTPLLVRLRGRPGFTRVLAAGCAAMAVTFAAYWVLVGTFREPLMHWLYAGRFVEQSVLLWGLGALPLLTGVAAVLASALRALERPDRVFWAMAVSSAVAVGSIALVATRGIPGAVTGRVLSALALLVVMSVFMTAGLRAHGAASQARAPAPVPPETASPV